MLPHCCVDDNRSSKENDFMKKWLAGVKTPTPALKALGLDQVYIHFQEVKDRN